MGKCVDEWVIVIHLIGEQLSRNAHQKETLCQSHLVNKSNRSLPLCPLMALGITGHLGIVAYQAWP